MEEDEQGPYIELCFSEDMAKIILTEEQLEEMANQGQPGTGSSSSSAAESAAADPMTQGFEV